MYQEEEDEHISDNQRRLGAQRCQHTSPKGAGNPGSQLAAKSTIPWKTKAPTRTRTTAVGKPRSFSTGRNAALPVPKVTIESKHAIPPCTLPSAHQSLVHQSCIATHSSHSKSSS